MAVDDGGDAGDEAELAVPVEGAAAVCADRAVPAAVIDFAEGCEDGGAGVAVHREHAAEVFEGEDAVGADLLEQAAGGAGRHVFTWHSREQGGFGQRGGWFDFVEAAEREEDLGFAARAGGDEQQPDGVAGHAVGDDGGERDVEGAAVGQVQPSSEGGDDVVERPRFVDGGDADRALGVGLVAVGDVVGDRGDLVGWQRWPAAALVDGAQGGVDFVAVESFASEGAGDRE